jgi:hypothetical protein
MPDRTGAVVLAYKDLGTLVKSLPLASARWVFEQQVIPCLLDEWVRDYQNTTVASEIVETTVNGFSYLFDIAHQRLIAAWGFSEGKHAGKRDKGRMRNHPKGGDNRYHRGHAVPHTLGGPTDINLVPQLGSVNIGEFRRLENLAVSTPGALYFSYWMYRGATAQRPYRTKQGLLRPGHWPEFKLHKN